VASVVLWICAAEGKALLAVQFTKVGTDTRGVVLCRAQRVLVVVTAAGWHRGRTRRSGFHVTRMDPLASPPLSSVSPVRVAAARRALSSDEHPAQTHVSNDGSKATPRQVPAGPSLLTPPSPHQDLKVVGGVGAGP
jgi:hypothetical protein